MKEQPESCLARGLMDRMLNNQMLRSAAAVLIVLGLLASPQVAHAADTSANNDALSVSPPTIELDGTPGQIITQKFTLDNISPIARSIKVTAQNFEASGEEGQAQLSEEDTGPNTLSSWLKVSPSQVTIPAQGTQSFSVTISVPKNASPGGHFGALVFEPQAGGDNPGANVKVVARVSSLILLRLPGNATERAGIASVDVTGPNLKPGKDDRFKTTKLFQKGPVDFHIRVKNDGNVQVKPQTTIEIRNMFGSKVATVSPDSRNVLPDSVRRFDSEWKSKSGFGLYSVKMTMKYGTSSQVVSAKTSFWVIPIAKIAIYLGIAIAVFLLLWLPRKRYKKAFKALASSHDD